MLSVAARLLPFSFLTDRLPACRAACPVFAFVGLTGACVRGGSDGGGGTTWRRPRVVPWWAGWPRKADVTSRLRSHSAGSDKVCRRCTQRAAPDGGRRAGLWPLGVSYISRTENLGGNGIFSTYLLSHPFPHPILRCLPRPVGRLFHDHLHIMYLHTFHTLGLMYLPT